jgi:hypothetical protein
MPIPQATLDDIFHEIAAKAAGAADPEGALAFDIDTPMPGGGVVEQRFHVGLPLGVVRHKLAGFPRQWFGQTFRSDDHAFVFRITLPTSLWRRVCGNRAGVEVLVRLTHTAPALDSPPQPGTDVAATIKPLGGNEPTSRRLSEELGRDILASLHRLLVDSGRRRHERLPWPHALKVTPVRKDGRRGESINGCGKDISPCGIGFYVPKELKASDVLIELPNAVHPPSITVPARVIRVKRCADGWYEAGALFGQFGAHSLSSRAQIIGRPAERITGTI